ncbi:MAG TPA: dTDP-4-dehydrorhamnose 3,5-epimerase [Acidimicrobiia bacterium]
MQATYITPHGVVLLDPVVHADERGIFFESWNRAAFVESLGFGIDFLQDNHSRSAKGVLRGLHYQAESRPQGKLVRVVAGSVWDVAVDIRRSSPTFSEWVGVELSAANHKQLWIPPGFAHGFIALSDPSDVIYKVTDYYSPEHDRAIRWDDPDIGIEWPVEGVPLLSDKDANAPYLRDAEHFA